VERFEEFAVTRVISTIHRILESNRGKTVLLVSHGGPLDIIVRHLEDKPLLDEGGDVGFGITNGSAAAYIVWHN